MAYRYPFCLWLCSQSGKWRLSAVQGNDQCSWEPFLDRICWVWHRHRKQSCVPCNCFNNIFNNFAVKLTWQTSLFLIIYLLLARRVYCSVEVICWIRRRLKSLFFIRLFIFWEVEANCGDENKMGLLMEKRKIKCMLRAMKKEGRFWSGLKSGGQPGRIWIPGKI